MQIVAAMFLAVAPAIFAPGVISTGDDESHPAFTPDSAQIYFIKNTPDFAYWTICTSRLAGGRWSSPEVAPFSGQYRDADPFITADGKHFLFISSRPVGDAPKRDLDIWIMDRQPDGSWGAPRRAEGDINSEANEWFPVMTDEGTIYFGSERAGGKGGVDVWMSRLVGGKYAPAENVAAVNTEANEYEPYVTPDGKTMIVAVEGRADSLGGFDLYGSTRGADGAWAPLKNLGKEINTPFWEFAPKLSPDGKTFYFASNRRAQRGPRTKRLTYAELLEQIRSAGNGLRDIYSVDAAALGLSRM